jgi:hypothetical protein
LTGRWIAEGAQLTLTQDTLGFVFEGVVTGDAYSGTLYLGGRRVSHFCALKGKTAPEACAASVAMREQGVLRRARHG